MPVTMAAAMLTAAPARASSLTGPISGYTTANVPAYISMYEYVPATPATNPPVLVVSHYCGGTAAGMFGIAEGGGLVAAADKYGFVMVFPQTSQGCWDISSTQTLTHDGGGDTQAIAEMVKYEITHREANANRAYATGQSSGAMMTEALLAVYPDVFKAGSEFSGVPAGGCWTCAGGYVDHTPQQWGALVDAMYPGYTGFRPRVQLWHGTADMTVNYNNQLEAIKEWTDVLGLSSTPTSTQMLTFNNHQWTRESWQDSCGFTVLDTFSEAGGPHNTDASEDATYVIPFLGLDQTGPVDPEVAEACGADAGSAMDAGSGTSDGGGTSGSTSGSSTSSSSGTGGAGTGSSGAASGAGGAGGAASGAGGSGDTGPSSKPGCGCSVPQTRERTHAAAFALASLLGIVRSRRRRTVRRERER
jgi:poly(hydroxyalkanoate) depolymerase family esterase